MAERDLFDSIEFLKRDGEGLLRRFARAHRGVSYGEFRFEVVSNRSAAATNGEPRDSSESENAAFGVAVQVEGPSGAIGDGQAGAEIGGLARKPGKLVSVIRAALDDAYERARASAREKSAIIKSLGAAARSLENRPAPDPPVIRDDIQATFQRDPRAMETAKLNRLALDASKAVSALGPKIAFNVAAAMTEFRRELFLNTTGSAITQCFAFSQGDCYVVAQDGEGHQESYDTIGQQRGFECLEEGWRGELMPNPSLSAFAVELAREAQELAAAPVLKPPEGEVVVVTDPHFNALIAHEIVGHPSEADRALKMEAAYAGRSWFLRSLADNELGRMVGSALLSACSDPIARWVRPLSLRPRGDAGTPRDAYRPGSFCGFPELAGDRRDTGCGAQRFGTRQRAVARSAHQDVEHVFPAGRHAAGTHHRRRRARLLRMREPVPSIAESRENFRISARRVYEIENGRLGRLFRSGSVIADSKQFFCNVDAVGSDLRLIAIPNCGKGQPMQVKRMSNGGPTLRSRARLGGG